VRTAEPIARTAKAATAVFVKIDIVVLPGVWGRPFGLHICWSQRGGQGFKESAIIFE
jgi:hypothetical protein